MKLLINHLTRMQAGCICVAGIDLQSGLHIRPVGNRQLSAQLLCCHGGPLELGTVLDIGKSTFAGRFPEIEDRVCDPTVWSQVDKMTPHLFFDKMSSLASESLCEIFGPELQPHFGRTFVVPQRSGLHSLGCFWAADPTLEIDGAGKLRFLCRYQPTQLRLPVTDIALFEADHAKPDRQAVDSTNQLLHQCKHVLVSVGLSRAYRKTNDAPALHYLQVNNIHAQLTCNFVRRTEATSVTF